MAEQKRHMDVPQGAFFGKAYPISPNLHVHQARAKTTHKLQCSRNEKKPANS